MTIEVKLLLFLIIGTALLFWVGEDVADLSLKFQELTEGVTLHDVLNPTL